MRARLLCCAQHAAVLESVSARSGPPQDVAEPLHQLDCFASWLDLHAMRASFGALTFGCDGASAAAPIANANTAFIVAKLARCASLTQPRSSS